MASVMPRPLYRRSKGFSIPANRRLVGLQSQSGRFGEVALAGIPVQVCPVCS